MLNVSNDTRAKPIQNSGSAPAPKQKSENQRFRDHGQAALGNELELSPEGRELAGLPTYSSKIEIQKDFPDQTIAIKTLDSRINHIKKSLEKADKLHLSSNERLTFLKSEGDKWVEDIRNNNKDMFVQWLKMNKENIENGRSDLAGLPSDFTIKDYAFYVHE